MSHLTLLIVQDGLTNGLVAALPGFAASIVATTCDIATVPAKFFPAKQVQFWKIIMRTSTTPTPSKFGKPNNHNAISYTLLAGSVSSNYILWPLHFYLCVKTLWLFWSPKCTCFDAFMQNPLPQGSTQRTSSPSCASNWPRRDYHHGNSKWEELHHTDKDSEHSYPGNKPQGYPRTNCVWNPHYTSEPLTNYQHWMLAHTHTHTYTHHS